ncbi:MAG: PilZ domain-containing protein [Proteobacteria bacterium]|nr:PilZ domain-containing protein [Pseudomonadota bacterium]
MGTQEKRKSERVEFSHRFEAQMMSIDGTWRRACVVEDVSKNGARLIVRDSIEGLHLKEFFLLLSSMGLAYRRCELAWVNGDQLGVRFLTQAETQKMKRRSASQHA